MRSFMVLGVDVFLALNEIIYFPTWHMLNVSRDQVDWTSIFSIDYYIRAFQGKVTNASTHLCFLSYPIVSFWLISKIGKHHRDGIVPMI